MALIARDAHKTSSAIAALQPATGQIIQMVQWRPSSGRRAATSRMVRRPGAGARASLPV